MKHFFSHVLRTRNIIPRCMHLACKCAKRFRRTYDEFLKKEKENANFFLFVIFSEFCNIETRVKGRQLRPIGKIHQACLFSEQAVSSVYLLIVKIKRTHIFER